MQNFNHITIIDYNTVLPGQGSTEETIVSNGVRMLNLKAAFETIARLNYTARYVNARDYHQEISEWFGKGQPGLISKYDDLITQAYRYQAKPGHLRLINLWSNLKLLEAILQEGAQNDPEDIVDHGVVSEHLLLAYLALNGIFTRRADAVPSTIPDVVHPWLYCFYGLTLTLMPYYDLVHIKPDLLIFVQLLKAGYFLKFFEEFAPLLLRKFLDQYDVNDWKEYLKGVMPVAHHAMLEKNNGIGYLVIDPSADHVNKSNKILTAFSLGSHTQYDKTADFKIVRAHPLLKVAEFKFLISDEMLIYNKLYNSLYFEFAELASAYPDSIRKGDFKGLFNDYFTENYLVKEILGGIFKASKKNILHFTGSDIKAKFKDKKQGEPDYYARDGLSILLFEIKDSLISGMVKQSGQYEALNKELVDKFYFATKEKPNGETKEQPKAIKQLLNSIEKLLTGASEYDKGFDCTKATFFPIMLYVDQALSTPGINDILQFWFDEEIQLRPALIPLKKQIMPLTIIDIDTLILYHNHFKAGEIAFEKIIPEYWTWKMQNKTAGIKHQNEAIINLSLQSFSGYLGNKIKIKKIADIMLAVGESLFATNDRL
jgi:hypothetical protein